MHEGAYLKTPRSPDNGGGGEGKTCLICGEKIEGQFSVGFFGFYVHQGCLNPFKR